MPGREVTEFDLRAPEFQHPDIKPEDYEFRNDGKIVRKDRWEQGFRSLVEPAGFSLRKFEIDEVVERIESTFQALEKIDHNYVLSVLKRAMEVIVRSDNKNVDIVTDLHNCINVVAEAASDIYRENEFEG